ncbi:MAG: Gfo/Idh/MocA family oxidoreductase [Deltaproteobacteria bacterium]|nr:MAG: Gfo/Idh/MocA family oxidoreductase [Deltaproteobacteria bacterium]TMQ05421.1 MAG: Gfo/Idh/MocA family oxidoreductase [Deltaproteobacteria bacterium]
MTAAQLRIGVIGYGYWGPNLVRNFAAGPRTRVVAIAESVPARRQAAAVAVPHIRCVADAAAVIADPEVDAVVIATPLFTHHGLARAALEAGKHVLVEKPLAPSVAEAEELAGLAARAGRVLMIDHTFVYTGAVRKIASLIAGGELGRVLYLDSVRINLGLFQPDYNVIWDLAPHDLTIIDFVLGKTVGATARWISAIGVSHYGRHENLAYLTVGFDGDLLAHIHVNWVAPVKTRRMIIAGSKKMLVWDDTSPVEPVKIYESSVDVKAIDKESAYALNVQYRSGDITSPKLDGREALSVMAQAFAAECLDGKASDSGAAVGVRIVRLLAAAQRSLEQQGARVAL